MTKIEYPAIIILNTANAAALARSREAALRAYPNAEIAVIGERSLQQGSCLIESLNQALEHFQGRLLHVMFAGDAVSEQFYDATAHWFADFPRLTVLSTAGSWVDESERPVTNPFPNLFGLGPLIDKDPMEGAAAIAQSTSPIYNRFGRLSACVFRVPSSPLRVNPELCSTLRLLFGLLDGGSYFFLNNELVIQTAPNAPPQYEQWLVPLAADVFSLLDDYKHLLADFDDARLTNCYALSDAENCLIAHFDDLAILDRSCATCRTAAQHVETTELESVVNSLLKTLGLDANNARKSLYCMKQLRQQNEELKKSFEADRSIYEHEIKQLHSQLSSIKGSYSWKLSGPVRRLERALTRNFSHV